jgi:iron complex outermembrane receptor protein
MSLFKLHKISLVALAVATSCYSATVLADDSKAVDEKEIEVIKPAWFNFLRQRIRCEV